MRCFLLLFILLIITANPVLADDKSFLNMDVAGHSKAYARYMRGLMHEKYGKTDAAIEEYKKSADADKTAAAPHLRLAYCYLKKKEYGAAEQKAEFAARLNPGDISSHFLLAMVCTIQGKLEEAISEYKKILELAPQDRTALTTLTNLYLGLAGVYLDKQEPDKALKTLEKALKLRPEEARIYVFSGFAYELKKDLEKAGDAYLKSIVFGLKTDYIYLRLGSIYERQEKFELAVEHFKKAMELNPDNPDVLNYLGYMYAEKSINLEEAIGMLKKALEIDPDNGAYVDSLGWAYYKKGMIEEALVQLEKAVQLMEDDPTIRDHLGDIYYQKGLKESAKKQWEKSLELKSDDEKVKKKLESLK